jgi:DNA-binding IclR family transcriptional regulator
MARLTSEQACAVLNAVERGAGYRDIAERAGVAHSTAYGVLKDLPLWAYLRDPKTALDMPRTDVYEEAS